MKWSELKKLGVKRCCAMFKGHRDNGKWIAGGQCRRRAVAEFNFDWCAKHGPIMRSWEDFNIKAINAERDGK